MKKYFILFSAFFSFSINTFTQLETTKIQTTQDKIDSINKEIEKLKLQQATLEKLKDKILADSINISKPLPLNKNPKIALVLSGGGAKGAAHIGVLKVIDKLKIPIDIVVGTSVGSIIGGMYSIGYSPLEIEKLVDSLKFDELLTKDNNRKLKALIEKIDEDKYPLSLSIDKDFNLKFPMGVTDGEYAYLQLKSIFGKAESITDFSKFPINFSAISTNLQTGKGVKIDSGDLALATFKSMAIPTFLDPINDDGIFYVDGGVIDNFPIYQALEMGADIIIAVDISAKDEEINNSSNIITILNKLASYQGERNKETQLKYADILISPDVKDHGVLDFNNLNVLVDSGEVSAKEIEKTLSNFTNPKKFKAIKNKGNSLKDTPKNIKNIITNHKNSEFLTKDILKLKPKKEYLNRENLNTWTEKIYTLDYVERVFYHVDETNENIHFNIVENTKPQIRAGISYLSEYGGALELSASVPSFGNNKKIYTLKSELSQYPKITLKDNTLFQHKNKDFLISGDIGYYTNPILLYSGDKVASNYSSNTFSTNLYLGTSIFNKFLLGYNLGYKNTNISHLSGLTLSSVENSSLKAKTDFIINTGFLYADTLDSFLYPKTGFRLNFQGFSGNSLNNKNNSFSGFSVESSFYKPISTKLTGGIKFSGGSINTNDYTPLSEVFSLGGLQNLSQTRNFRFYGLPLMGIYSDKFIMGEATFRYSLAAKMNIIFKYNVASYDDAYKPSANEFSQDNIYGYGGGIAWDTFLGPMEFIISNNILGSGVLFQTHLGYTF